MNRFAIVFTFLLGCLLSTFALVELTAAQPPAKPAQTKSVQAKTVPTKSAPLADKEIAEAKAKGLVWTNPTTKVYHKGGEFYGKTTSGKFMTEAEAIKQYYRPSPDAMKGSAKAVAPSSKKK